MFDHDMSLRRLNRLSCGWYVDCSAITYEPCFYLWIKSGGTSKVLKGYPKPEPVPLALMGHRLLNNFLNLDY